MTRWEVRSSNGKPWLAAKFGAPPFAAQFNILQIKLSFLEVEPATYLDCIAKVVGHPDGSDPSSPNFPAPSEDRSIGTASPCGTDKTQSIVL